MMTTGYPDCDLVTSDRRGDLDSTPERHGDVICYAGARRKATDLAQSVADLERRPAYVLKGYRRNKRGFLSPAYYVSRHAAPRIVVEGLPSAEVIGPPFSSPLLIHTALPTVRSARRADRAGGRPGRLGRTRGNQGDVAR